MLFRPCRAGPGKKLFWRAIRNNLPGAGSRAYFTPGQKNGIALP